MGSIQDRWNEVVSSSDSQFNELKFGLSMSKSGKRVLPDAFDLIEARAARVVQLLGLRENAADGVDADDQTLGAFLFDLSGQAADGAASAGSGDQDVQLSVELVHDFLTCAVVVSDRVVSVRVLVQNVSAAGLLSVQSLFDALGLADVRVWRVESSAGWRADDGGAKTLEDVVLTETRPQLTW